MTSRFTHRNLNNIQITLGELEDTILMNTGNEPPNISGSQSNKKHLYSRPPQSWLFLFHVNMLCYKWVAIEVRLNESSYIFLS